MKSLIKSYLSSILIGVISFFISIILARYLTIEDRGSLGVLITILSISTIISTLSLDQSIIIQSKKMIKKIFIGYLIKLYFLVFFLFTIIFTLSHYFLNTNALSLNVFIISIIYSFVNFFSVLLNSLILTININYWNFVRITVHIINFIMLILTYYFFIINSNIAYLIFILSSVLVFFIILIIIFKLRNHFEFNILVKAKDKNKLTILSDGFKIHFNNVVRVLIDRIDQLFLIAFFDKTILAYYLIGVSLPKSMTFIIQSVDNMMINKFKKLSEENIKNIIIISFFLVLGIFLIFTILFGNFSDLIIKFIYGEKYSFSSSIFLIFILGAPFYLLRQVSVSIMKSKKMFKSIFYSESVYIFLIIVTLFISKYYNEWIFIVYGFNIALLITSIVNVLLLSHFFKLKLNDIKNFKIQNIKNLNKVIN